MRYIWRFLLWGALSLGLGQMAAHAGIIGPAADYNVFVFGSGNFQGQNTDTTGNLAVGGNVNLNNYGVAQNIAGNPALNPNPARLVVGGNLTAVNGGVGQGQNGAIYVGGTASLTSFTATGGTHAQTLVDFAAAQSLYQGLSADWAGIATNGTASTSFGTLTLTGTSNTLNVFSLTAADISNTNTVNISAPTGATVLINVTGDNVVFQNGEVNLQGGLTSAYLMYNFVNATSVTLAGSKNPKGSILAASAGVVGNYGAMDGQLITGSFGGVGGDPYGHTQFNNVRFLGDINAVPLPAGVWLMLSGLAALGGVARRRGRDPAVAAA